MLLEALLVSFLLFIWDTQMCFLGSAGLFSRTVPTSIHCAPSGGDTHPVTWGRHLRGQATDQHCPDPGTLQSPLHV